MNWLEVLPERFPFYHLGEVRLHQHHEATPLGEPDADRVSVAFSLLGDFNGTLVVRFDRGLDLSTYSELGNIIASQLATRIADEISGDVMISPPQVLSEAQSRRLLPAGDGVRRSTYVHSYGGKAVPIEALILQNPMEGAGNA